MLTVEEYTTMGLSTLNVTSLDNTKLKEYKTKIDEEYNKERNKNLKLINVHGVKQEQIDIEKEFSLYLIKLKIDDEEFRRNHGLINKKERKNRNNKGRKVN
jgi:hypothetical protein